MVRTLFAAFAIFLFGLKVVAFQKIEGKLLWSADIQSPSQIIECDGKLLAYSHDTKSFTVFLPQTGKIDSIHPIVFSTPSSVLVSAQCWKEKLLIVTEDKLKKNSTLYFQLPWPGHSETLALKHTFEGPHDHVLELKCSDEACYVLTTEEVLFTKTLTQWQKLGVPFSPLVERVGHDPELNPFEHWQDKLQISHGFYSRLSFFADGKPAFLDPFRAQVVIEKNGKYLKWGGWGAWEGFFFSPKMITILASQAIAVSDTGLKNISFFTRLGRYLGQLSDQDKIRTFQYAMGLATIDNVLFVADFLAGKVMAFDLKNLPNQFKKNELLSEESESKVWGARSNLFRRKEVLDDRFRTRCLMCHDGTMTDQLDKYSLNIHHHPLNLTYKGKTDLKMEGENFLTCATCHNPHHIRPEGKDALNKHNPYLKRDFRSLCLSCHIERGNVEQNHPNMKDDSCVNCHHVHATAKKLLILPTPELCNKCHKEVTISHQPLTNFIPTERAKNIHFDREKISCVTCHAPHGAPKADKFLRPKDEIKLFCSSCHGAKAETLYKDFHKRMKLRRGKK